MIRRYLTAIFAAIMLFSAAAPTFAATKKATTKSSTKTATKAAPKAPAVDPKVVVDRLRTKGEAEIQRRFDKLNAQYALLQATTKIDAASKQTVGNKMQAEATTLGQLKTKIHDDTDLTVMRADIKSLGDEFAAYHRLLEVGALMTAANSIADTGAKLITAKNRMSTSLGKAVGDGKNVDEISQLVDQSSISLTDLNALYQAVSQASAVLDTSAAESSVTAQRDKLKSARTSLVDVRTKLSQAATKLAALGYSASLE